MHKYYIKTDLSVCMLEMRFKLVQPMLVIFRMIIKMLANIQTVLE